jgi:predicted nucleic acid-binding protein
VSSVVLDAYSVIAFLEREPGYEQVEKHFEHASQTGRSLLMCTVNWGEVYYSVLRETSPAKAEEVRRFLETLPIELVSADINLARQAAIYKASHKMSFADCFAAALAKSHKAILVTGDKDFKQVAGDIKISWL